VVHLAFNVVGVLIWLPLIPLLARMAEGISPASVGLEGVARMAEFIKKNTRKAA